MEGEIEGILSKKMIQPVRLQRMVSWKGFIEEIISDLSSH